MRLTVCKSAVLKRVMKRERNNRAKLELTDLDVQLGKKRIEQNAILEVKLP